ncbi:unnamed protein product [Ectocarpus sp. 8 AP-2014]
MCFDWFWPIELGFCFHFQVVFTTMVCMVFVVVSREGISKCTSSSPIFSHVHGLQNSVDFLTRGRQHDIANELREIENECGVPLSSERLDAVHMLGRYCTYLPPLNEEVDTPTAVLAFYTDEA